MTSKYEKLCAAAREKCGLEPDVDETLFCEYCLAKYVCEV